MTATPRGRGGKREGAGRKPVLSRPVELKLRLEASALERLDCARGPTSRAEYLRAMIDRALAGESP